MAIPGNMWLFDDGGALIKGGCDVQNREYSIEFKGLHHNLSTPTDNMTGKPTGKRIHSPLMIVKEFDYSSPYLYKAVATGQILKKAELKFYKINVNVVIYFRVRVRTGEDKGGSRAEEAKKRSNFLAAKS